LSTNAPSTVHADRANVEPMKTRVAVLTLIYLAMFASLAAETRLTISAAASVKTALLKTQPLFLKTQRDVRLEFNFSGSGVLQRQIEAGAPVDVFLSAGVKQMDALAAQGLLLEGSRHNLLTNQLALITGKNVDTVSSFPDLAKPAVQRIAIGAPGSVPAGMYAAQVFQTLGISAALEPKLVRMLDVRQVLTAVETGNAAAGVVYITDARLSQRVRIAAIADEKAHEPIVYPIAIIRGSRHAEVAKLFVAFLSSEPARAVFEELGFGVLP
jgi:molybdate transport system substrate-binding protein